MMTITELRLLSGMGWLRRGAPSVGSIDESYDVIAGGSIQAALDATPEGGTIRIGPGKYRLTSPLQMKTAQSLVGPYSGEARITGDVVLSGWVKDGSANRWYTTSGNLPGEYTDNGQCEIIDGPNANSCQKREQVWIGGEHMERVMTVDQVTPDRFYQDFATGRTYIGQDPAVLAAQGKVVEMARLGTMFSSVGQRVRLTRLTVERFASPGQSGAVVLNQAGVEVGYCKFTENHAIGLHITLAHNARIHHNQFIRNGQLGMGHHRSHDTVVEDNLFLENNTDKFWRADWESGGFKATYSDRTVCRRNTAHNNEGIGIWFDIDNIDIECYENTCTDNYADGIRYEISQRGRIYRNTISGNGFRYAFDGGRGADYSMFAVGGINVNSTPDVEIFENDVSMNQNGIVGQSRNRGSSTNPNYGIRETRNLYVHHNRIRQGTGTRFGEGIASGMNTLGQGDNATRFYTTMNNRFDYNEYEIVSATDRRFAWNQSYLTFANFQAAGQEVHGVLRVIPRPGIRVSNALDDGHFTMVSTPSFSTGGTSAVVGHWDIENYGRAVFLRFRDVQIPKGAVINSAVVEVKSFGIDGEILPIRVVGHASDDSPAAASRNDMVGRVRTAASVPWSFSEWINNAWVTSPSIASVIQEIVNRPGWVPGGSITIFLEPLNNTWNGTTARVSIRAYEQSPTDGAGLIVDWS